MPPVGLASWDLYEFSPCNTIPQEFKCSSLLRPTNGYFEINDDGGDYDNQGWKVGTVAKFYCNYGYTYEGPLTSNCTNKDWTYFPGKCRLLDEVPTQNSEYSFLNNAESFLSYLI